MGEWAENAERLAGIGAAESGAAGRCTPATDLGPGAGVVAGGPEGRREDVAFQSRVLEAVSRTFALTIPQLPGRLSEVVGNAYLLCRIADTIEDDAELAADDKRRFSECFVDVVEARADALAFAEALAPALSSRTAAGERELISNTAAVVRLTHSYSVREREALARCVRIMARGMAQFQSRASRSGLRGLADLDRYCYCVAGVVGEMLTVLFCEHSAAVGARRDRLSALAVSFGQGLQMTNILKDIWEDYERGACWLPREHFAGYGFELERLARGVDSVEFAAGLRALIGVAHYHLVRALEYTLLIPETERGIRRFCLWAIGMAVLTLRNLYAQPNFQGADEVKISRRSVKATVLLTSAGVGSDRLLRLMFRWAARGLPMWTPSSTNQ